MDATGTQPAVKGPVSTWLAPQVETFLQLVECLCCSNANLRVDFGQVLGKDLFVLDLSDPTQCQQSRGSHSGDWISGQCC